MKTIRVGVVGAGAFAARRHLPALKSDARVTLVAACRRDPAALARVADHFGIPERFTDWEEMLDSAGLDAVLIATPHDQHAPQAEAALRRGLHVLLEKPMARTVAEARRLSAVAAEGRRCLLVAFNPPYWEHTHLVRDAFAAGRIGTLESVHIHWSGTTAAVFGRAPLPTDMPGVVPPTLFRADPGANGGGNLMDGGGHLLSELLWVTGGRPVAVTALMDQTPDDSRASLVIQMDNGVLATVSMVGDSRFPERRVRSTYAGTQGSLEVRGLPFTVGWRGTGDQAEALEGRPAVPSPAQDWIDCIESGGSPLGSPEHGVLVTHLLTAAYESAAIGRAVTIPPVEREL